MIRLFTGYDEREAIGWHVFTASVLRHISEPVEITPLQDFSKNDGSNRFTYIRYAIPQLCDYTGWALFMDGCDMLATADIAELWALRDDRYAVQLVQHPPYLTKHGTKYRGEPMESPNFSYPRKNWTSCMLINCGAPEWRELEKADNRINKHRLQCFPDARIGDLPRRWNVLVDEGQEATDTGILHWTAGIPAFEYYRNAPCADIWFDYARQAGF